MKNERAAVVAVIAAALALSSLPYVVAYLVTPPDRRFMGIVSSVPDWSQYLAWMRAFGDRVIIDNVLTCEAAAPAFFNLQWLVLGRLANWLPADLVLQLFRLGTAAFFLWLTHRICAEYFRDRGGAPAQWAAWLLINFSSGFGWFWVLEKRFSGALRFPMDVYIYEPVSFQNMVVFPHFLLAAALLLLIFRFAVAAIEEKRNSRAFAAAALALILGLTHAYDLIIVYGVLAVFVLFLFVRDGVSWRPPLVVGLIGLVSAPPPAYFLMLTTRDPLWSRVLSQFKNAGVFTPEPLHLLILVGLPLLLMLATWRNVVPAQWPRSWPLLVRVWAVVNLPLLYIPTDYQVHMLSGWQIPLGLLAAEGVFGVVVPRLAAWGWVRDGARSARRLAISPWGIVLLLFALSVPTNLYLLAWRVLEVLKLQHTHYLYADETAALSWLDANARDEDVVLGSVVVNEYVPFLAGNKVHAGHWAQTVGFEQRKKEVRLFFDAETPEAVRQEILSSCKVRYVLYGREERHLGRFDPAAAPYLQLAHVDGKTSLYRVELAEPAAAEGGAPRPESVGHWSEPQWLSRGAQRSAWFPDVAADDAGGVHVFWHGVMRNADAVFHCKIGPQGCAETDVAGRRPSSDGYYVTRPSAGSDATGTLHLLWKSKFNIAHTEISLPDPIDGWTQPRKLGEGTYTALAVEPGGTLHAAWTEPQHRGKDDPCSGCVDVMYSRSADGVVWSPPVNLSRTPTGSEKPNIALAADGSVYIAWEEGKDFYVAKGDPAPSMMIASHDRGVTWETPVRFSPADLPQSPAIAVAGDGTVVAVWRSSTRDGFFSQTSADRGATWSEPRQVEGILRRFNAPDDLDGIDLATDSAGVVHLIATGRIAVDSEVNAVFHSAWDGRAWSPPDEVFRTTGAAEWPRLAIANGNALHAVWFEREAPNVWNSEKGNYRIWYSRSSTAAPRLPAAVWPAAPYRLLRPQTVSSLLEAACALTIVAAVIAWARLRGL